EWDERSPRWSPAQLSLSRFSAQACRSSHSFFNLHGEVAEKKFRAAQPWNARIRIAESGKCRVVFDFLRAAHWASLRNRCQRNLNECGCFGNVASHNWKKIS